jgi:type I restriction enzyme R subunit
LAESGWAVVINEQEDNFKIQDLERKVFTPDRNRLMCEAFLREAQRDPTGALGKSIIFAVNQTHATNLTKIFNTLQPGIALTITSRIPEASSLGKEFRVNFNEGYKRTEKIAVSVDMLSTGYNCKDLLNIGLMRPIFSPTEYIQIKGRGTRLFTFKIGHTEYKKDKFFLLDFCAVAEYFEDKYDYTMPLKLPRPAEDKKKKTGNIAVEDSSRNESPEYTGSQPPREIPVWTGIDTLESQ